MTFAWPSTTRVSTVAPAQMVINSLSGPGVVAVDSACGCCGMFARARDPSAAWSLTYGGAGWGGARLCPPLHSATTGLCTHLRRAVAADGLTSYLGLVGSECAGVQACARRRRARASAARSSRWRYGLVTCCCCAAVISLCRAATPQIVSAVIRWRVGECRSALCGLLVLVGRHAAHRRVAAASRTLYVGTCNQLHVARLGERSLGFQWATDGARGLVWLSVLRRCCALARSGHTVRLRRRVDAGCGVLGRECAAAGCGPHFLLWPYWGVCRGYLASGRAAVGCI